MFRTALIVLEILIGVAALAGGVLALTGAKGVPRQWLAHTPFKTYVVPGLILLAAVGGSMLVAAGLLLGGAASARLVSLEAGVVLLGWIATQLTMIGFRHWLQPVSLLFGLGVVALSFALPSPG